jgi:hypothetical protein
LTALANLSNHMLVSPATKSLSKLKSSNPEIFSNPGMYYRALEMIADHHYKLNARRYILELFDVRTDEEGTRAVIEEGERMRDEWERRPSEGELERRRSSVTAWEEQVEDDEQEKGTLKPQEVRTLITIKGFLL